MKYLTGEDRQQLQLFVKCLKEVISANNEVQLIGNRLPPKRASRFAKSACLYFQATHHSFSPRKLRYTNSKKILNLGEHNFTQHAYKSLKCLIF